MLQSINPIAQQSQRWIIQALLDLMEEMEYNKISVTEICRKAGLDRRTFYRNFDSKNDVLEQYVRFLEEEHIKMLRRLTSLINSLRLKSFLISGAGIWIL